MKKFMVLFTALMFLATFSLIGCNQSQPPAKPAAEKGAKERPEHPELLEHLEHLERLRQKKNRCRISGVYPRQEDIPFAILFRQRWPEVFKCPRGGHGEAQLHGTRHVNADCHFKPLCLYRVHKNIEAFTEYRTRGAWYNLGQDPATVNFSGWFYGPGLGTTCAF